MTRCHPRRGLVGILCTELLGHRDEPGYLVSGSAVSIPSAVFRSRLGAHLRVEVPTA